MQEAVQHAQGSWLVGYPLIGLHPEWESHCDLITAYAAFACVSANVQQQTHTASPCITQQSRMQLQFSAKTTLA